MLRKMLEALTKEVQTRAVDDRRVLHGTIKSASSRIPSTGTSRQSWQSDPLGQLVLLIDKEMRDTDGRSYREYKATDSAAFQALKGDVENAPNLPVLSSSIGARSLTAKRPKAGGRRVGADMRSSPP
ncbi:MAG: hypothetical protein HKN27_14935 [Silicimonas sp.]|nr:hypothetical protein [Silicimonas sp.]